MRNTEFFPEIFPFPYLEIKPFGRIFILLFLVYLMELSVSQVI